MSSEVIIENLRCLDAKPEFIKYVREHELDSLNYNTLETMRKAPGDLLNLIAEIVFLEDKALQRH